MGWTFGEVILTTKAMKELKSEGFFAIEDQIVPKFHVLVLLTHSYD